jgi:hypothetical protein
MRESTVRGAAIDIDDFERRLRSAEPARKASSDPLSELARLMQGAEQAQAAHRYDQIFAAEPPLSADRRRGAPETPLDEDTFAAEMRGAIYEDYPQAPSESGAVHDSASYSGESFSDASHARGATYAGADLAARHFAARPAPQLRTAPTDAQGDWADDQSAYPEHDAGENMGFDAVDEPPRQDGFMRLRPWHAVVAIALVASTLLAWGLAKRSGAMGAREIATISAPDGPAKVPPTATAEAGADKPDAAVLDRHENAQVKHVVSHQEQAVEPKVEPRVVYNGVAPSDEDSAVAPTGPQPKKIKTVSVRPDGSIIANAIVPPAVVKAAGAAPRDAAAKHAATTPTSTTKPTATPRPDKTVKPKPAQKIAAVEEDAEVKAPATTHKIDKGAFAVQFGAAATEAEAHALVTKVATKYGAQLGGHRPTFRMAKVGDKTVYRVRVGGMSKESAASICGNVKSSGGSCFIAGD